MPERSSNNKKRIRVGSDPKTELRVVDLPTRNCRANPDQPRKYFDEEAIKDLAASIERHGLIQPITVKRDPKNKEAYVIVAGERRFRAYELLKRETVPAIITTGNSDEIALIENLQRQDLSPIEEAEALLRLQKKYGYTHEELGKSVGKARSTITNFLRLNSLPAKIKRESISSNLASKSFLIELSKLSDSKKQLAFWKEAKEKGITVKEARARKKPALNTPEAAQKAILRGEQFVKELEHLGENGTSLDSENYEKLLGIFERFVSIIETEAERKQ